MFSHTNAHKVRDSEVRKFSKLFVVQDDVDVMAAQRQEGVMTEVW